MHKELANSYDIILRMGCNHRIHQQCFSSKITKCPYCRFDLKIPMSFEDYCKEQLGKVFADFTDPQTQVDSGLESQSFEVSNGLVYRYFLVLSGTLNGSKMEDVIKDVEIIIEKIPLVKIGNVGSISLNSMIIKPWFYTKNLHTFVALVHRKIEDKNYIIFTSINRPPATIIPTNDLYCFPQFNIQGGFCLQQLDNNVEIQHFIRTDLHKSAECSYKTSN